MSDNVNPARRIALIIALVLGALILAGTALTAIPRISGFFTDYWNGQANLVTGSQPNLAGPGGAGGADYAGVNIASDAALTGPRVLQAVSAGLGLLVIIAASALIVILAIRMLRARPLARVLSWGLGIVGGLVVLLAAVAPQLEALAVDRAVTELGYPVLDAAHDGVFTPGGPDVIQLNLWDGLWVLDRVDPTLLLLGVMLVILAFLVARGIRLQRDTEGLV